MGRSNITLKNLNERVGKLEKNVDQLITIAAQVDSFLKLQLTI